MALKLRDNTKLKDKRSGRRRLSGEKRHRVIQEMEKDLDRWFPYINKSPELAQQLAAAPSSDEKRSLLEANTQEDWLQKILDAPEYDWVVDSISDRIIMMFKDEVESDQLKIKPKPFVKRDRRYRKWRRNKTVTYFRGRKKVSYKRGSKKWNKQETEFLIHRPKEPAKNLAMQFKLVFGFERSMSSLIHKRERLTGMSKRLKHDVNITSKKKRGNSSIKKKRR